MHFKMAKISSSMIVLALTLASLDSVDAQSKYNSSSLLRILATTWHGAGYSEGAFQPLYLHRPAESLTYEDCLPRTGTPSKCPVELLTLEPVNQPPPGATQSNLNFTMMIHGDVFTSSPGAEGYYDMPEKCRYVRNHTVFAEFNASSLEVEFTILETTSDLEECTMSSADVSAPGQRCGGGSCYPDLNGLKFYGMFQVTEMVQVPAVDAFVAPYQLDMTIHFPYKHQGSTAWSGYRQIIQENFLPIQETLEPEITQMGTDFGDDGRGQVFMYSLTTGGMWQPREWFRDRKPYITGATPSFGPEEGGPVVTITGVEFPDLPARMQASIVLEHDGEGGQERECCETVRLDSERVTCKLPRVACLNEQSVINNCPKPGAVYENQTVSFSIRPTVQGAQGELEEAELDDFLQYEGIWELEDNDVYGGMFVQPADRIPGERHLVQVDQAAAAAGGCCPVCPPGEPRANCQFEIRRLEEGVYEVQIPAFMSPGNAARAGICDRASNMRNTSVVMAIERSTDPDGFSPNPPLSVTNCIDQRSECASVPTLSIRETCKQLVWSTGVIRTELPAGQTREIHEWISNRQCDRRMRCVGGKCAWTHLARNPSGAILQRRTASPQMSLAIDYKNDGLDPKKFLEALAPLVGSEDADRLQILEFTDLDDPNDEVDPTTSPPEFVLSEPVKCLPDEVEGQCRRFELVMYIVSDGPNRDGFSVVQDAFTSRAAATTGDPDLRRLNLEEVCVDSSTMPADVVNGIAQRCIDIQYPGVLQFQVVGGSRNIRVKEEVWAFARLGVTRTGGSDLGVTVDYRTYDTPDLPRGPNASAPVEGVDGFFARGSCLVLDGTCAGLGQDYMAKIGQLRWEEGDAATKYIIIPIVADDITEESETFEVQIFDVVNATDITEAATVTIAGINNTPTPRYIQNMQQIIGAVCGAATAVPCALFAARLIRSLRRGSDTKKHRTVGKKQEGMAAEEEKTAAM